MDTDTYVVLSITLYKALSLLIGTTLSYMGYKLFVSGIWGDAGTFGARHEDTQLVLKNAAPGTFFALFGALVILFTLYKGLELETLGGDGVRVLLQEREELPDELDF